MDPKERLTEGNRRYLACRDRTLLENLAQNGQHPYATLIACSDSRVVPEKIFMAEPGELFVIRTAGNVVGRHQLASVEYALSHLGCRLVVVLGHTGCGAIGAALEGPQTGVISVITDDILASVGRERDGDAACRLNVLEGVARIRKLCSSEKRSDVEVLGAIYDLVSGKVSFL